MTLPSSCLERKLDGLRPENSEAMKSAKLSVSSVSPKASIETLKSQEEVVLPWSTSEFCLDTSTLLASGAPE